MKLKKTKRALGRPRSFETGKALDAAMKVFETISFCVETRERRWCACDSSARRRKEICRAMPTPQILPVMS